MTSDFQKHLATQLAEAQSKYVYFLLAVTASAIALVVQRTTGHCLNWNILPLGVAVLCWAVSFFAGCRNRLYFNVHLITNAALLQVQDGTHPDVPNQPGAIVEATQGIKDAVEFNSSKAKLWADSQFNFLVAGAILFLTWHILEMSKIDIGSIFFHQ
jgi:hypothetical protein